MEPMTTFKQVVERAKELEKITIAVANAADREVLEAVRLAIHDQIADFLLFGDVEQIQTISQEIGLSLENVQVQHTATPQEACLAAVQAIKEGKAASVMKGMVQSADFLRAVLKREMGLRGENVLSHVATLEVPAYSRFIHVTDPVLNIAPTLEEKIQIVENIIRYCHSLGMLKPKIAVLGALEVINPKMPITIEAANLTQMFRRKQIQGAIIDGPLALDNAISPRAAKHKGIESPVAGQADVLLVPDIEAGNILYKSMVYFAKSKIGGLVLGAKVPVVLTSRADSAEAKLYSMALAVLQASWLKGVR